MLGTHWQGQLEACQWRQLPGQCCEGLVALVALVTLACPWNQVPQSRSGFLSLCNPCV